MITTGPEGVKPAEAGQEPGSVFHFRTFAGVHDFAGVDGFFVDLFLQNLSILANQEVHSTGSLVFVYVDAVFVRRFAAPVAQERKGDSNLVGKSFVGEGAVHAHTQNLGVGGFQLLQVLLEVFHLLRSTAGEGENIKGQDHVLFSAVVAEGNVFQFLPIEVLHLEVGSKIADLQAGSGPRRFFL